MADHRQITITIPSFTISRTGFFGLFILTAGLIAAYIWGPKAWHEPLVFAASVLASSALLVTAADSLDSHGSQKEMAQKVAAMDAIERWNSPQFYHCKRNGREVQAYFKAHPAISDQLTYLDSAPELRANLMDVLNHFEALAIGIANRIIDNEIAKDFFYSMALQYWNHSEAYIKNRRAEQNNARLFDNFEALKERWETKRN